MMGCAIDDGSVKPYTPMKKGALMASIESCIRRAKNGFAVVFVKVMPSANGFTNDLIAKRAEVFGNMDDLLGMLMDFSLTCSIADVCTIIDHQIMYLTLVETDGLTTNIDSDVMGAISKLYFKGNDHP